MTEDNVPSSSRASEAQFAANLRNAQDSTGPRTEAGKRRSSQNSTRHGIYAGATPIPRGPFAEDPEAVSAELDSIVVALRPRDDVELAEAHRIASLYLRLARVDRLEAEAIAAHSDYDAIGRGVPDADPVTLDRATGAAASRCLDRSLTDASLIYSRLGRELERALKRYALLQARIVKAGSARLDAIGIGGTNPITDPATSQNDEPHVPDSGLSVPTPHPVES